MEKIVYRVVYASVRTEEDNYEEGYTGKTGNSWELDIKGDYASLEKIIQVAADQLGVNYSSAEFAMFEGNLYIELQTDVLQDDEGNTVVIGDRKYELWQAGKINLWDAQLSIGLQKLEIKELPLEKEEFIKLGVQI